MSFGSSNEIDIKVKVDSSGAITTFDKFGNKLDEVKSKSEQASKAIDGIGKGGSTLAALGSTFSGLSASAALAATGITALGAAATGAIIAVGSLASKGSDIADIEEGFNNLATKAGAVSSILANDLDEAFGRTIERTNVLKEANKLLLAGIDPKYFKDIAQAARGYADQIGGDTKQVFDAFSQSVLTGNDRILKQYGLVIDNKKALEGYAQSLGTTADKLDEVQILEANRIGILSTLTDKSNLFGIVERDTGDAIASVKKELSDQIDKVLLAIGSNQQLRDTFIELAESIRSMPIDKIANFTNQLVNFGVSGAKAVGTLVSSIDDVVRKIPILGTAINLGEKQRAQENILSYLEEQTKLEREHVVTVNKFIEAEKRKIKTQNESARGGLLLAKNLKEVKKTYEDSSKPINKNIQDLQNLDDKVKKLLGLDGVPQMAEAFKGVFTAFKVEGEPTTGRAIHQYSILKEKIDELIRGYTALGQSPENIFSAIQKAQDKIDKPNKTNKNSLGFDFGFNSDDFYKDLQQQLFNGLSQALEGALDKTLKSTDWKNIGANIGGSLAASAAASINPALAPVGQVVGEQLTKYVLDAFDNPNAGRQAREAADKYFAEIFNKDRLQVVIDGQLKGITDLVFDPSGGKGSGFTSGTFDDLFKGLPAAAQGAFAGVGSAYESLLSEMGIKTDEISGQLAAVFVNNIGGSINNLQLLIEATGKSIEELGNALLQTFLDSKKGALETANAIIALKRTMEAGIPDAFGAIDQAYKNIMASLESGGRALFDAIADVGVEASELGIRTLPQVADVLVNRFGFAANAVQQFMAAMAAAGVKTLNDLKNASQETLLAIAANAQALQQGGQAVFTGDQLTTAAPSTPIRSSGGSSSGRQSSKDQKAKELADLIRNSDQYLKILQELQSGLVSESQSQKLLNKLFSDGRKALSDYEGAQKKLNDAISKGKKPSIELAQAVEDAKNRLDKFTKQGIAGLTDGLNSKFVDFASRFKDQFDLIQIAAEQAGSTLEDFKKKAVDSFLSSSQSAKDALSDLQDATGGISGEKGGVNTALKNIIAGGTSGGLFSLKNFQALAKEAKEVSAQNLSDLEELLRGQGADVSTVQKLFIELKNQGIDSLDELASLSGDTAIRIISGLEDLSFPFEQTSDRIKKINDDLSKIPSTKDITINIKAILDSETMKLLDKLGLQTSFIETGYGSVDDKVGIKKPTSKNKKTKPNKSSRRVRS